MIYRGRFAPSPSGPLHFGSLVAAMGSYLDAKSHQGVWLVRIENIDPPREVPGAADRILRTLEAFGFEWDEQVLYQSSRLNAYQAALDLLQSEQKTYECTCSRSKINAAGVPGIEGMIYPGTCRRIGSITQKNGTKPAAIRLITNQQPILFQDGIRGNLQQNIANEIGDFILRRADGYYAYQLAVVVDDAFQKITDVVRGSDLLLSTPRQIYLQQLLDIPTPAYKHLPLVVDDQGKKLSKQSDAIPVDPADPLPALRAALSFLGQSLPSDEITTTTEFWKWAISIWKSDKIR